MRPTRRALLLTFLVGCGARRIAGVAERGVAWMLRQQAPDGSFPSRTYGQLAGGAALTPFVLDALLGLPAGWRPDGDWSERALRRLDQLQGPEGALGLAGPVLEYPTYATALWLRCLARLGRRTPAGERAARWLADTQYGAAWAGHAAHGGWGMGYRVPRVPPDAGHVDLSMTRRAAEALSAWGGGHDAAAAVGFVSRCATTDGGFVYSPVELALNKAGCAPVCRAYGSATADGLLALRALGAGRDGGAVSAAAWLDRNADPDRNPGIPEGPQQPFGAAMVGCWRAAAAQAWGTGGPAGWRATFGAAIAATQRPDGSWANPSYLQREDDPIIATGFALTALGAIEGGGDV